MSRLFNLQPRVEISPWLAFPIAGAVWAARKIGRALLVGAHNPRYAIAVGLGVLAIWNPWVALGLAVVTTGAWIILRPASARESLRGWWRSNRKYRWTWGRTLRRCNAAKPDVPLPLLLTTSSTPYVDKLRVRVPTGLDPSAFQDFRGDLLKWAWRAQSTRVFNPRAERHTVELWNLIDDPLIEPVAPFLQSVEPLPHAGLPLFLQEDGAPWLWKVRGGPAHLFVCGISGSGKGSVIGAILDALRKGIADDLVEAWGIDPQASELGMWRHLFKKLVYTQSDAADMLHDLRSTMHRRTRFMFGRTRQHQPTPGDKLYVLIADEGLMLLDKTDRKLYRRIVSGFGDLTRGGRKASIVIVFLSQRAELDLVEIRKDFPNAIALRQRMENDVNMVLGRGALESGAEAHEITLPGVAYAGTERGIVRGRFPRYDDDYIRSVPAAPGNEEPENLPAPPVDDNDPASLYGFA